MRAPANKKAKIQVNLRLYKDDVRRAKALAAELDIPWQAWFRAFVHRALHRDAEKGKIL